MVSFSGLCGTRSRIGSVDSETAGRIGAATGGRDRARRVEVVPACYATLSMSEARSFDTHATVKVLLACLFIAVPLPAGAQDDTATPLERFELFTNCRPMGLMIEGLPDEAADIGLTQDALTAAVESRLRAARLHTDEALPPYLLYVNVSMSGRAFSIDVYFNKVVFDQASLVDAPAITWNSGTTGTHGRNAGYIVNAVSQHLDRFLADYLRVNESACDAR